MARPRKGEELRKLVAIRLEPSEKELLVKHFGGVQAAIDDMIEKSKKKEKRMQPKE